MRKNHSPGCPCCGETGHVCLPCPIPRKDLTFLSYCGIPDPPFAVFTELPFTYRDNCVSAGPFLGGAEHTAGTGTFAPYWYSPVWECTGDFVFWDPTAGEMVPVSSIFFRAFLFCGTDGSHGTSVVVGHIVLSVGEWISSAAANAALDLNIGSCDVLTYADDIDGNAIRRAYGGTAGVLACCNPFHVRFPWPSGHYATYDGSPDTPTEQEVCVTVRGLVCEGEVAPLLSGVLVTVNGPAESASATTGVSGRVCLTMHAGGLHTITAELGDCSNSVQVDLFLCDGSIEVEIVLCCTWTCLDLTGLYADATTFIPLEDAEVTVGVSSSPILTDSAGRVCFLLDSAEMLNLPIVGDDCDVRRVPIAIEFTPGDWLPSCFDLAVPCGRSQATAEANPVEVTLLGLLLPPVGMAEPVRRYIADLTGTCPDLGCDHPGWDGRGLLVIPALATIQADYLSGGVWYSLMGSLAGVGISVLLDGATLTGTGTGSPYDAGPAIEYRGSGSASMTPNPAITPGNVVCADPYEEYATWIRPTGAIFDWYGFGYDPDNQPEPITIPPDQPDCAVRQFPGSEVTAPGRMRLEMPATINLCIPEGGLLFDTGLIISGNFRYRIIIEE